LRILLLADPNSAHIVKWATSLAQKNIYIAIFGLNKLEVNSYKNFKNIRVVTVDEDTKNTEASLNKLNYLKALPLLKKVIKNFNPNILHAHYATSYGLLGALSNFKPFIISVWGSDVFSFPNKTFLHKKLLEYNLKKANEILSTSKIMAKEIKKYTNKDIKIVPFGIDLNIFKQKKINTLFSQKDIVIGTIKALEKEYGIELLLRAFKILSDKYQDLPLKLLIVGSGSLEKELKNLAKELNIYNKTIFSGKVSYKEVPKYHNMITIPVFMSSSESFGVAIIEASACNKAVVVSDVGGLPEVVKDNITGIIVKKRELKDTVKAIEKLILDKTLREKMGKAGRERVTKYYNWNDNIKQMINIYEELYK